MNPKTIPVSMLRGGDALALFDKLLLLILSVEARQTAILDLLEKAKVCEDENAVDWFVDEVETAGVQNFIMSLEDADPVVAIRLQKAFEGLRERAQGDSDGPASAH